MESRVDRNIYNRENRDIDWFNNHDKFDPRGGHGVRWSEMLGRTTVGKASGDGGLGWADCWPWRLSCHLLLRHCQVQAQILIQSAFMKTCCPITIALSGQSATTVIASRLKWACVYLSLLTSCLTEALKFKPPTNCCVISFKAPLSPLEVTANSSRRTSFVRSTSQRSLLSSFKSIDSSPKTPPISTVLEDSVFTSSAMDQQSLTTRSKTTSSSDSGKMNETISTSQESSSLNDKPDWTNFTLDQKMNLLLDMSFKNSFEIRKVSQDLSQHTEDIKTIMTTLNKNSADIKSLSTNLNTRVIPRQIDQ
ncbi:hypothetical protein KQX54_009578 [Cotesia glomerata]|uniref:Uncharacterized protein n=1 Tax=Cotesia glomerata TaxID=32391 RepID=A0AAV7IAY9_COTGL|nr:hypothetical protein KQX54_009578 [Cotesia glomerata]